MRRDVPRRRVLADESALAIARSRPADEEALRRVRGLEWKVGGESSRGRPGRGARRPRPAGGAASRGASPRGRAATGNAPPSSPSWARSCGAGRASTGSRRRCSRTPRTWSGWRRGSAKGSPSSKGGGSTSRGRSSWRSSTGRSPSSCAAGKWPSRRGSAGLRRPPALRFRAEDGDAPDRLGDVFQPAHPGIVPFFLDDPHVPEPRLFHEPDVVVLPDRPRDAAGVGRQRVRDVFREGLPTSTMSEIMTRPPGFSTRKTSENTCSLSVERLMTQLEMTASTEASAAGRCSISPSRNSTFVVAVLPGVPPRLLDHVGGHVHADDAPRGADLPRTPGSSRTRRPPPGRGRSRPSSGRRGPWGSRSPAPGSPLPGRTASPRRSTRPFRLPIRG